MKNITELTDEDALKVFDIMGSGNPISDESKIFQTKVLLTTNKFYTQQTNLPGNTWLKIFKYLKSAGYSIGDESPESPSPSLQEAAQKWLDDHKHEEPDYRDAFEGGANWQAQQTGLILTRELHDKIWEGATDHLNEIYTNEKSCIPNGAIKSPDKETFYKSLNL